MTTEVHFICDPTSLSPLFDLSCSVVSWLARVRGAGCGAPIASACRIGSGTLEVGQLAITSLRHVMSDIRWPGLTKTAFVLAGSGEARRACASTGLSDYIDLPV